MNKNNSSDSSASVGDPVVLVLGLGASGEAAAQLLLKQGRRVWVADAGMNAGLEQKAQQLRAKGCEVMIGSRSLPEGLVELAVISPGIAGTDPWVLALRGKGIPVISELELGWRACRSRILAVTGSNGKSTLVKLCSESLQKAGFSAMPGGNYGTPLSALACVEPPPEWVVVEVSSFQLEAVEKFVPDAGILLNLNPNHLDRHGTMEQYAGMKARLFRCMGPQQVAVIPENVPAPVRAALPPGCRVSTFGVSPQSSFYYADGSICGAGLSHPVPVGGTLFDNEVMGVTAAACVAALVGAGVPPECVTAAAKGFESLPHRMQTVAEINGVTFINDSKATNLAAMSAGVRMTRGPVRLIAGGLLKEKDLDPVKKILVNKVLGVYIIGKYSLVMADAWRNDVACVVCADLKEAVKRAWQDAKNGDVILLSPGCASFDQFKGFEDRGEQFSRIVRDIQKGE
jgi:UDP-N-acetylmuramoylalanine--D-glutamate ligase